MEEWRDIPGYEGLYKVSNKGHVFSVEKNAVLRATKPHHTHGNKLVDLYKEGRATLYSVKWLVAFAFS